MPDPASPLPLAAPVRAFLDATPPRHATVTTTGADGAPWVAILWYRLLPDDGLLLNSRIGRVWPTNLLRDPRCVLSVEENGRWVALRGAVETIDDRAQGLADILALADRYHAGDAESLARARRVFTPQDRISFILRPVTVAVHL